MTLFRGRLSSEDLAVTQEASFQPITDWSTTSLSLQDTDLSFNIALPKSQICLFAWADLTVEHTVSGATFDVELDLYFDDALSNGYIVTKKSGLYIPAANARVSVSLSFGLNVPANLPLIVLPGNRLLRLRVKNNTAGTLTLRAPRHLHAFCSGDDTI